MTLPPGWPRDAKGLTLLLQRGTAPVKYSDQWLPLAILQPNASLRHVPGYSLIQHTRGRISCSFLTGHFFQALLAGPCNGFFAVHWAKVMSSPHRSGSELWVSGGRALPGICISTPGIVAVLYCYFWYYIMYLLFLYSLWRFHLLTSQSLIATIPCYT